MCGRFTLTTTPEYLAEVFDIEPLEFESESWTPRFNISPGQDVTTVAVAAEGERSARERRWGLIPPWADDPKIGYRMINARSETVAEKPAFRAAFRERRCLIPADGFYEWEKQGRGVSATKQPYYIGLEGEGVFAMAGLWEAWTRPDGERVESCSVITTTANERIAFLHERMPVILPPEHWQAWLDPTRDSAQLLPLLAPYASECMTLRPVSPRVNDGGVDDAECLAPYEPPGLPVQYSLF